MEREPFAGPESGPTHPYPIQLSGKIIKGFGRGSKELGIPTANIPITGLDVGGHSDIESGVYFGWAGLRFSSATGDASTASGPVAPGNATSEERIEHQPNGSEARVDGDQSEKSAVFPMVMSIGWNPFYKNEVRSVEVHLIHKFEKDFYNAMMNLSILGFIRYERDYDGLDSLVKDINTDIDVSKRSLERPAYEHLAQDHFLKDFSWVGHKG